MCTYSSIAPGDLRGPYRGHPPPLGLGPPVRLGTFGEYSPCVIRQVLLAYYADALGCLVRSAHKRRNGDANSKQRRILPRCETYQHEADQLGEVDGYHEYRDIGAEVNIALVGGSLAEATLHWSFPYHPRRSVRFDFRNEIFTSRSHAIQRVTVLAITAPQKGIYFGTEWRGNQEPYLIGWLVGWSSVHYLDER